MAPRVEATTEKELLSLGQHPPFDAVRAVLERAHQQQCLGPQAVTRILKGLADTRRSVIACHIIRWLQSKGQTVNVIHYGAAINVCAKDGEWLAALELLTEMETSRCVGSVVAYNSAICACERSCMATAATHLLDRMCRQVIEPNTITHNSLISACAQCSLWLSALVMLQRANAYGIVGNTITFNSAISACGRSERWRMALQLWRAMEERGNEVDTVTLNTCIGGCGQWRIGGRLIEEIGIRSSIPSAISYNTLVNVFARVAINNAEGNMCWKLVSNLLRKIRIEALSVDRVACNSAINACSKANRWSEAIRTYGDMFSRHITPDLISVNAVSGACAKSGKWVSVAQFVLQMTRQAHEAGVIAYSNAIGSCEKSCRWERTTRILQHVCEQGLRMDHIAHNSYMGVLAQGGRWSSAVRILYRLRHLQLEPTVVSFTCAIRSCSGEGRWAQAENMLFAMQHATVQLSIISGNCAVSSREREQQWERICELLHCMRTATLEPDVITNEFVAGACQVTCQWVEVLAMLSPADRIGNSEAAALESAIHVCSSSCKWSHAFQLFCKAKLEGVVPDIITLDALLEVGVLLRHGSSSPYHVSYVLRDVPAMCRPREDVVEHHDAVQPLFEALELCSHHGQLQSEVLIAVTRQAYGSAESALKLAIGAEIGNRESKPLQRQFSLEAVLTATALRTLGISPSQGSMASWLAAARLPTHRSLQQRQEVSERTAVDQEKRHITAWIALAGEGLPRTRCRGRCAGQSVAGSDDDGSDHHWGHKIPIVPMDRALRRYSRQSERERIQHAERQALLSTLVCLSSAASVP